MTGWSVASVVVLGLGAHAPLLSLDRPGYTLSATSGTLSPATSTPFSR